MNFTRDFLHQLHDPNLSIDERALLRCELARQLEDAGNYEAAREAMGELWTSIGESPRIENLNPRSAAEVLLRVGTLTGWLGSTRQIEGAQEAAKNLISQSLSVFVSLDEHKKIAEAQVELGYCYWREGAIDEARIMLREALSKLDNQDGDLKALALLRSAMVERLGNRLSHALHQLMLAVRLFESSTNHSLKGRFHNEYATVLKNLGAIENRSEYIDQALIEYEAASYHFGKAGHARYQACVENNLAMLFLKAHRLNEAHNHLVRAQALFTDLGDNVHLAQVEETMAQLLLAEGNVAKAETFARSAVQMLNRGGEQSILAEALITHGIALSRLHQNDQAQATFERAIQIAQQGGHLDRAGLAAITLIEEVGQQLSEDALRRTFERARDLLRDDPNPSSRDRLLECAFRVLSLVHTFHSDWTNYSLEESVHRYEARTIRRAIEEADGNVSRAARLLGMRSHQSLHDMLSHRHRALRAVVAEVKRRRAQTGLGQETSHCLHMTVNAPPIKILHVEDNDLVAEVVKEMIEERGWQLETCSDGNEALERIEGETDYDLLLVDYKLPDINGLALVRRARQLAHRSQILIIVLSATPVEAEARDAGADVFLYKPLDVNSLVETVIRLVAKRE